MKYLSLCCHMLTLACCSSTAVCGGAPPSCHYDQLYVFGNSFSDIGEGYLDGNGPTAVAYLAKHLNIRLLAANSPHASHDSLDFAISGAGTGSGTGTIIDGALLGVGMHNQVDQFRKLALGGTIHFQPATTLFFIAGGLNDEKLSNRQTIANLTYVISTLYASGARNFMVALLPSTIPAFSNVGKRLNPSLRRLPSELMPELVGSRITISHWGSYFDDVLLHAGQYGFTNTALPCAGRAIFHQDSTPCKSPNTYFYYHEGHPSTAVHRIVGKYLYEEVTDLCSSRAVASQ